VARFVIGLQVGARPGDFTQWAKSLSCLRAALSCGAAKLVAPLSQISHRIFSFLLWSGRL